MPKPLSHACAMGMRFMGHVSQDMRPPYVLDSCMGHVPLGAWMGHAPCAPRCAPWPTQTLNGRNDKRERERWGRITVRVVQIDHFMIMISLLAGVLGWGILAVHYTGVSASVRRAVGPAPSGRLLHAPQPVQGPGLRESLLPLCCLSRAANSSPPPTPPPLYHAGLGLGSGFRCACPART